MADESQVLMQEDVYKKSAKLRWLALMGALFAWMFDGVEQGVYNIMTRAALKDLIPSIKDDVAKLNGMTQADNPALYAQLKDVIDTEVVFYFGIAAAVWLIGAAIGGVLFGSMGDKYGRVRVLIIAVITYSTFTGLSAFSGHWTHLALCRFLGALGLGGAWPLSVAIIVETWPEKHRSVLSGCMGMAANIGFWIAGMYIGMMLTQEIHWRWIIGMGFFLGLASLPILFFVPEPTKWKISRAKKEKTSIAELFTPRYRRSAIVGMLLSTVALVGAWGSFLWLATYADQIAEGTEYAGTAKATVATWQAWGQMFGGFLGGVLAALMGGNKRSWIFLCITSWLSVFLMFYLNTEFTYQMCWMGALAGLFVTAYFGWLPKYLPELFPTRIRATGQGFAYNGGRIITAGTIFLGGWLSSSVFEGDYRKGAMTLCTVYLLGLIIIVFAPKTGGKLMVDEEEEAA